MKTSKPSWSPISVAARAHCHIRGHSSHALRLALEANIDFVKSQIDLYRTAEARVSEQLDAYRAQYRAIEEELRDKQAELRSLRQTLVQPSSSPSRAMIEEIVRLQNSIDRITSMEEAASILAHELGELAKQWVTVQDRLKQLPPDELSPADKQKLDQFENSIRMLLERFGFISFQPAEIKLSRDNFRPLAVSRTTEGEEIEKDIGFEISASDAIRLKWSYYLSLLVVAEGHTNHPDILIFDEPGQQEIEAPSLYEFLKSASVVAAKKPQQVIVSTSEPIANVRAAIGSMANIVSFEGFILQPISS